MNEKQRKAIENIKYAVNDLLGGLENTLEDHAENEQEHIEARNTLKDHDGLVKQVYMMATTAIYREGYCSFSKAAESQIKDIRFCGKEWLMAECDKRITKEGY